MDIEPTYSETAAESLFRRGLAERMTPEVQAELKQIGIDLARPFSAAYPQEVWERGVQCVATRLFADLPAPQAHTEVGRRYMVGFQHTLVGRATTHLGRLIGPERTLHRMQRNQRHDHAVVVAAGDARFFISRALAARIVLEGV